MTNQRVLGPRQAEQLRSAIRAFVGRKGDKRHFGSLGGVVLYDWSSVGDHALGGETRWGRINTSRIGVQSRKSPGDDDSGRQALTTDDQRFS
jgi:hypothetical protein